MEHWQDGISIQDCTYSRENILVHCQDKSTTYGALLCLVIILEPNEVH